MTWKCLRHLNVLPLLGVTMIENRLVMVSEWMENGNVIEFVKANDNVDRLGLVCSSPDDITLLAADDDTTAVA